jgi:hypothetical protein
VATATAGRYPWDRYWVDRDTSSEWFGFDLRPDPESIFATAFPLVRIEDLDHIPLLILVGQPGMGKSTVIEDELTRLAAAGFETERVDLGGVDTGELLRQDLGQSSAIQAWRGGAGLYLFIDSLDRALVELSTVHRVLEAGLRSGAAAMERLRVRIACRSADWDDAVRDRLVGLWPERSEEERPPTAMTLELQGLSGADVRAAAQAEGLNGDWLLEEITNKGAEALAGTPITLKMILSTVADAGVLSTRTELYRRAVQVLADEHDPLLRLERRDMPGPDSLLALAARSAAALLLCDRAAVSDATDPRPTDVSLDELRGGLERPFYADGPSISVELESLRAPLSTGLLRLDGQRRAVFAHHTYAEYLCAMWLAHGPLSVGQVESLLVNPHDPQRRLLSHLRDVAGWLAALRPDVFGSLIATQAEVLLRGDLSLLEPEAKAVLVEALLERASEERIDRWDRRVRDNLGRLGFPGLRQLLQALIRDRSAPLEQRQLAISLAETNRLTAAQDELAALALDRNEVAYLRDDAARALARVGDVEHRQQLIPLAVTPLQEDPDDEIKGAALSGVWPGLINTKKLLSGLHPPKRRNLFGAYKYFLLHAAQDIPEEDLAWALQWAAEQPREHHPTDSLSDFVDDIVRRGWQAVGREDVAQALAKLFAKRLAEHHDLIGRELGGRNVTPVLDNDLGRRQIVERLTPYIGEDGVHPRWVAMSQPPLLRPQDAGWLCERVLADPDKRRRELWADLLESCFWPETWPVEVVLETAERSPVLADRLKFWLGAVDLDSPEAALGRKRHAQVNPEASEAEDDGEKPVDVDVVIAEMLERFEGGDRDAWWHLNLELLWDRWGKQRNSSELEPRIVRMPGWGRADQATRSRLLNAASVYLEERDANPAAWLAEDKGWRPAWAGYRALVLLREERPQALRALCDERWAAWAPAIVSFPRSSEPDTAVHVAVLRGLQQAAPAALIHWAMEKVRLDDAREADPWRIGHLRPVLDYEGLAAGLLEMAASRQLRPATRLYIFGLLLEAGVEGAAAAALKILETNAAAGDDDELVVGLMEELLRRAPSEAWPVVWPIMQRDPAIGRRAVEGIASYESFEAGVELAESAVADLYVWLEEQYPHAADPEMQEAGFVSPRQQLAWWRERLLEVLVQRRTAEAVVQLRRLQGRLPHLPHLSSRARAAETAYADEKWLPPTPRALIALTAAQERRLVQSGDQLQSVVLESLERANERLQGDWPKAWQLWNDEPLKPKTEERLSDWVKDWLDRDLGRRLVTSREPQVRPTMSGKGVGARNDLRVELPADDETSELALIIEVKCCWHPRRFKAVKSQLADDYLRSAGLEHGIYVLGVYGAPGWTGGARSTCGRLTPTGWQERLDRRATEVSIETGLRIRATVLDVRLHSDRASR